MATWIVPIFETTRRLVEVELEDSLPPTVRASVSADRALKAAQAAAPDGVRIMVGIARKAEPPTETVTPQ